MENDIKMEVTEETKKSKLPIIGIVAGVVVVLLLVALLVFNSPKLLFGRLVNNTPDAVMSFLEEGKGEKPLFMTESHKSETKLSTDGEVVGMNGELQLDILTGYQNSTGDFALELEVGIGDLDAITAGLFLNQSEVALVSSLLAEKYIVDLESEVELGKNTTLEERLMTLIVASDDEELNELVARAEAKVEELKRLAFKHLKNSNVKKGSDTIEIFGADKKTPYVEVVLDEEEFKEWAEAVLEVVAEDDELEDLVVEIAKYLNDEIIMDEYSKIDVDEIDIEESCEEAIDDLDEFEADVEIRIYRSGSTPIAYYVNIDGEEETEIFAMMRKSGDKAQVKLEGESAGEELLYDIYVDGEDYMFFQYEIDDMKYEMTMGKVKGVYEVEGTIELAGMVEGKIEGEIVENKNETTFDLTYDLVDEYGSETEIKYEGSIAKDGAVTTTEMTMDIAVDGEDTGKVEIEAETEEVKKNKEYTTEGELKINDVYSEMEYVVNFENTTIFGDEVELDLPSWSKNDVYAKASDQEALQELLNTLSEDFTSGISDIVALVMYGGLY